MKDKSSFRWTLLRWYHHYGRDLPWRRTRDPYAVLISEIMLQQTQVTTVLPRYTEWLSRFPNFESLARASENDVLHAWQGLGYYQRARNLRATAKLVADRCGGRFPATIEAMRPLPGIGKYTAHALACFAFDQSTPIVEANTTRVLTRLFNIQIPIDQAAGRRELWTRASALIPKSSSAHACNSALIDLGALVCLPRPKCDICPVRKFCRAKKPEVLPRKKAPSRLQRLVENHAFAMQRNRILLQQASGRWQGMWILPPHQRSPGQRPIHDSVFPFTHHRITLRVFPKRQSKSAEGRTRWVPLRRLDSIPIPSPHRRAIAALLSER